MPTIGLTLSAVVLTCCVIEPGFPPPSSLEFAFNTGTERAALRVPGEPLFKEQAVFDSIDGKQGHHAATLAAMPDGELLAAWYSYTGPGELDGSAIYMARRPADAEAWQPPRLHIDRPVGDGNPVLYSEADTVWLFQAVVPFSWSTAHIEVQRSVDRGRTWSDPVAIEGPLGSNVRYPPVRTAEGDLVLPAYDDLLARSLFFSSTDGEDWTLRSAVFTIWPHQNIQPSVVRLAGGRLLAVMRNVGRDWLWVMASDDHGRSWSRPRNSGFPNPGSAAVLLRLASGRMILIFNDSRTVRRPLSIALSTDEGQTWSVPKVLAEGDADFSYPAAIQAPDGLIHILYTRDRRSIQHVTLNEAWLVRP